MCGITGYISTSNNFSKQELDGSLKVISYRGPDNQSVWLKNNVGLGHRRLSIIDLSDKANQPMLSNSGRYVMVYNGEVYNFKEIAEKYKLKLKTNSDSEVIVEAFEKAGKDIVKDLNGMFAIVIYDKNEEILYLFRDRIGIKPLFYYYDGKNFAFASELKSLLQFQFIKSNLKINNKSVSLFLQFGYIPEPHTFFENIYKFPSGSYGSFRNEKLQINKYWKIEAQVTEDVVSDINIAKTKLRKLITESVKKRMLSDVPLGIFLSGGIDSSLITAVAQSISDKPVKTFSIGFKENKYNESVYAEKVAKFLKTDHYEFIVSEKDVLDLIDNFFNAYDEPFADASGFPTMLVSKLAKKYVTVVLSGDGGDELFHGYGAYIWANRLNNPLINSLKKPIAFTLSQFTNKYKRASKLFQYSDKNQLKTHIFSQEQYFFSDSELRKLLIEPEKACVKEEYNYYRKLTPAEHQALFDLRYYLKDDLLTKVDRASMQFSLETRVPLLDHNIVEFAVNLHPSLKIRNKKQKYLLKQILFDYIPEKYFDRPKWGFSIPLSKWLKTDLAYLLEKYLSKEIIGNHNVVSFKETLELRKKFEQGQDFLYNRLWSLMVLHKYLEKYFPANYK